MMKSMVSMVAAMATAAYAGKFDHPSESREAMKFRGIMSAAFTPVDAAGELDFTNVPKMVARLDNWGVKGVLLGGTTGESVSFTTAERLQTIHEWLKVTQTYDEPLRIYVNVQHESLWDARAMATEVSKIEGVSGIYAMSPVYFKPATIDDLVDSMAFVAAGAPDMPFWYYHFPDKTGVTFNMKQFVEAVDESEKIPNFMGLKFTYEDLMNYNAAGQIKNKKYNMLFGRDEILTSALATGVCDGSIGSLINFSSFNIELKIAADAGDYARAQEYQLKTVNVIEEWTKMFGSFNVQKSLLKMTGIDFGGWRLPQSNLTPEEEVLLGTSMKAVGLNITDEYVHADKYDSSESE